MSCPDCGDSEFVQRRDKIRECTMCGVVYLPKMEREMSEKVNQKLEAKFDWVLIRPDAEREQGKTEAGIIMLDGMSEDVKRGTVVAVGIGKLCTDGSVVPPQTQPGAYVAYQAEVGHIFMIGSTQHIAIKEEDIIFEVKK